MASKFKDYMIRWAFKASWTFLEAAMILNEKNPENSEFVPSSTASDRVSTLYVWLVKEKRRGFLPTIDDDEPLRSSPDDIISHVIAHKQHYSKDVVALWGVARFNKNIRGMLAKISWAVYENARDLLIRDYREITKEQIAQALWELPLYYRFPNDTPLMPLAHSRLLKKLRNSLPDPRPGRPKKSRFVEIDVSQIVKEIHL